MKKPEKGKKKKIIGYNYLGMVGIAVIALVLLGSLMVQSKGLQQRLDYYNSKAAALDKSIDSEKERTKEIEAQEVSGESEKRGTNREGKADMESEKGQKGSR